MLLNYVKVMHYYHLFQVSVRNGDSVMIECIYKEFNPIYLVNGKYNYFIGMVETFYGTLSTFSNLLDVIHGNHMMPLYDRKDKYNNPMSTWAQDGRILENLQKIFHSIPFEQSQHVLTMEKLMCFCKREYTWTSSAQGRKTNKEG